MKHNVGETVFLKGKINEATISEDGITYGVMLDNGWGDGWYVEVEERKLEDCDCILLDDYEREINDLKEDVSQWKDMYQIEHLKFVDMKELNERQEAQWNNAKEAVKKAGIEDLDAYTSEHVVGEIFKPVKEKLFSHNPEKNTYAKKMHNFDDWRMP